MEDPVDHTLGRSFQIGIHSEKLLGQGERAGYASPLQTWFGSGRMLPTLP
jgi:hypothetical protein